jgi:surfactin synthase thioesterase subunit
MKRVLGTSSPDGAWIKFPKVDKPLFKLFWFPYSVGGATTGAQFSGLLPPNTEVICLNSPSKQKDPSAFPTWREFADFVFPLIVRDLAETPGVRFAFVGHSFGSLVVYLMLVYLRRASHRLPEFVVVSSKRAPQLHVVSGESASIRSVHKCSYCYLQETIGCERQTTKSLGTGT